jgi:hypothetical protein
MLLFVKNNTSPKNKNIKKLNNTSLLNLTTNKIKNKANTAKRL